MAEIKHPAEPKANTGYEASDVSLRPIVTAGVILVAVIIVSVIAMNVMFNLLSQQSAGVDQPLPPLASSEQIPPGPRLEVSPAQDLIDLRRREDEILNSYGWVDEGAEVVHIPIERAMEMLLENGLPTRNQE